MNKWCVDYTGNIFDTNVDCIGHGVNCIGLMGAGLAAQIKKLYPTVFNAYKAKCDGVGGFYPGEVQFVKSAIPMQHSVIDSRRYIANMATQYLPGRDATLERVNIALHNAYVNKPADVMSFAFPQIGCGIGGLSWVDVKPLIIDYSNSFGIYTELWSLA